MTTKLASLPAQDAKDIVALELEDSRRRPGRRTRPFGPAVYPLDPLATVKWRRRFYEGTPAVRRQMISDFMNEARLRTQLGLRVKGSKPTPKPRPPADAPVFVANPRASNPRAAGPLGRWRRH